MGDKVTLDSIENVGHSSGLPTINENFELLANEFDKVMYRDGSVAASDNWDMDSNRLINLPSPLSNTEPVRLGDILAGVSETALSIVLASSAGAGYIGTASGLSIEEA